MNIKTDSVSYREGVNKPEESTQAILRLLKTIVFLSSAAISS